MTKFQHSGNISKVRPELIRLIHDKVISLCQKKYSSFEVDGVICITLLDTREQQVVKIHKTLKSVTADKSKVVTKTKAKNSAYPNIAAILSSNGATSRSDSNTDNDKSSIHSEERVSAEQPSYQNDINRLSDLLKETNEHNKIQNKNAGTLEEPKEKKSKRKNRHPKQVLERVTDSVNPPEESADVNHSDYDVYTDSVIIVKEEPIDCEYDSIHKEINTSQKQDNKVPLERETNDSDVPDDDNPEVQTELNDPLRKTGSIPVSTYIGSIIDKTLGVQSVESQEQGQSEEAVFSPYISQRNDNTDETEGSSQKHSEWLYNLAQRSLIDTGNNSGSDSGSSDSLRKTTNKRYQPDRERGRQEPDPYGRSWYEMIKSNANKYQAALMRSGIKDKTGDVFPTPATNSNFEQLRELLKDRRDKNLVAVEEKKVEDDVEDNTNNSNDNVDNTVSSTAAVDVSDSDKSRSITPTPVVKIEVDEQEPFNYDQDLNEASGVDSHIPANTPAPKPPGKLESRYPALFNQLQQSRREVTPSIDQPDSLVNRLPFISFQEIFSQSGRSVSNDASIPAAIGTSFERNQTIEDQSKTAGSKKSKTVWNWKKRAVRPKDKDGNILEHSLPQSPSSPSNKVDKPLGIHMSAKKTFTKKRNRVDDDEEDADWTPSSDKKVKFRNSVKDTASDRSRLSTRLSSSSKPRIDFAEIDMSDPDEEDLGLELPEKKSDYSKEDGIELVSAYCRYQCGRRFETFGDLAEHEDVCEAKTTGSNNGADGNQTGQDKHTCDICGLDFNQQYRWQYHMVKVHGVSVNSEQLFR